MPPVRVVAANVGLWQRTRRLLRSRELVSFLVRTQVKVRYKNSVLGILWSMLNPAMMIGIYYLVFAVILPSGVPLFAVYLFSGLVVWNLFSTAIMTGTSAMVSNAGIVKKVAFSREVLPISAVGASLVFFFFQFIVVLIVEAAMRHSPAWGYVWVLIPALAALLVLSAALSLLLSAVNVYLRDVQHLVEVFIFLWMWLVPIIYPYEAHVAVFERYHIQIPYLMDPVVPIVLTFQRVLYAIVKYVPKGSAKPVALLPVHGPLWYCSLDLGALAGSLVLFFIGLYVFGRIEGDFAEEL